LLVALAILLLDRLVALDGLHELLLDECSLLAADLAVAVGARALALQRLDAALEVAAERGRVVYERVELGRDTLRGSIVRVVQRA
jgi:hypothetical protein